jgi:CheY-like chemotaxis protein
VETSSPYIDAAGHELTVTLPPTPVYIEADPTRLAQVVSNLLNNSARYTAQGGHIELIAERVGCEGVIRVCDDGIGIPAHLVPRIFEMFAQADRSLERSQGGLGIGLCLVRSLVQMHGGTVTAHSDGTDRGTEFVVRLPVADNEPPGEGADTRPSAQSGSAPGRRILVVDDNKDGADSLGLLLRMQGNEVRLAYDGPSALDVVRAFRPEMVLLDIGLTQMSGHEVARRLRAHPEFKDVVLIALTGWGQAADRERSRQAGFDHHLTKPVDFADLEKLLATYCKAQA